MAKNETATMTDTVKAAIKNSGMSLNSLARSTGVQVSSLSRFMRDEQDLVFGAVQRLASVLGLRFVQETTAENSAKAGARKEARK